MPKKKKKKEQYKAQNFFITYKNDKEVLTFENIEIEKKSYHNKTPVSLRDVGIEKVLVSDKISFGEKNY